MLLLKDPVSDFVFAIRVLLVALVRLVRLVSPDLQSVTGSKCESL